jgi:hypothetical protein
MIVVYINLGPNETSQYRKDYTPYSVEGNSQGPNMDSVTLRKTHFKLGDHSSGYATTQQDMNKNIDGTKTFQIAKLDDALKNDLRKSHFIMGNHEPVYQTIFQQEYFDKSKRNQNKAADSENIEKALRSHNYILGSDKVVYKSETQEKYIAPKLNEKAQQKISTHELQQSHYKFGTSSESWATTSQINFGPKVYKL